MTRVLLGLVVLLGLALLVLYGAGRGWLASPTHGGTPEAPAVDPDTAVEELGKTVPLGHVAEPEEIADVIAFLASHDARYVCGETVEVSGAKPVYA